MLIKLFQAFLNKSVSHDSHHFSHVESKNIILYVLGIMAYKFALETYIGSISIIGADRFPKADAFAMLGALQGANQACQCIGSILVSPLISRYRTNTVLSLAIWLLCLMAIILLLTEASTGGTLHEIGTWNIVGIFPIFLLSGIGHGMVELIRRIIPQLIVGENVYKLRKMDSLVHAFYEIAGTSGAFFSLYLILNMGSVFANCFVPPCWILAGLVWYKIELDQKNGEAKEENPESKQKKDGLCISLLLIFKGFFISIYKGAQIVFSSRKFIWLILGYSVPLVMHRYLESQLSPAFAKHILKNTAYSQVMVGGSNFGELIGATFVFIFTLSVHTPLPWVRLDALTLNLLWVLANSYPTTEMFEYAWLMALMCFFISFGWAAGDVSLSAYIQSSLNEFKEENGLSPLGAVMAFLYTTYIVVYACLSFGLGKVIDKFVKEDNPHGFLFWISGIMMSIACTLILISTFIPKGSFKLNPTMEDIGVLIEEEKKIEINNLGSEKNILTQSTLQNVISIQQKNEEKSDLVDIVVSI